MRGKEAVSDCRNRTHVSAHDVDNFLPWFDPWPLTLTPLVWLSTQWSDPVSNQSDSLRTRSTSPKCFKNELCCVVSCVCRRVLTLKHHKMTLESSTSSSWVWWKPYAKNWRYIEMLFRAKADVFSLCIDITHCSLILLEFSGYMNSFTFWEIHFFPFSESWHHFRVCKLNKKLQPAAC